MIDYMCDRGRRMRSLGIMAFFAAVMLAMPACAENMVLTSPDIAEQRSMSEAYINSGSGCSGGNLSPALQWRGAPAGTKSFVLTVYDPDAPTGSGWWHWVVYNLPPSVDRLARGAGDPARVLMPAGAVQGRTDFGTYGYGGPCPPWGDRPHRYVFIVHALDIDVLPVKPGATAAMVGFAVHAHELAAAKLTTIYGR